MKCDKQTNRRAINHQVGRPGKCVCLPAAGLSVAEHSRVEALDSHFDEALNARVLENVLLGSARLEHHVVREQLRLLQVILTLAL